MFIGWSIIYMTKSDAQIVLEALSDIASVQGNEPQGREYWAERMNQRAAEAIPAAQRLVDAGKFKSFADAPKELFEMAEKDSSIADKIATAFASHNCFHGVLEEAYILANVAVSIAKQSIYPTKPKPPESEG
jgi:hypothetical protein